MSHVKPADIVGNRIVRVMQTPWHQIDDVTLCQVYIVLDSGLVFELTPPEDGLARDLGGASVNTARLIDVDFGGSVTCNGDIVLDVLRSEYWPTIGLLLSSGRYLHCGSPTPGVYCACLSAVGEIYEPRDVERY